MNNLLFCGNLKLCTIYTKSSRYIKLINRTIILPTMLNALCQPVSKCNRAQANHNRFTGVWNVSYHNVMSCLFWSMCLANVTLILFYIFVAGRLSIIAAGILICTYVNICCKRSKGGTAWQYFFQFLKFKKQFFFYINICIKNVYAYSTDTRTKHGYGVHTLELNDLGENPLYNY